MVARKARSTSSDRSFLGQLLSQWTVMLDGALRAVYRGARASWTGLRRLAQGDPMPLTSWGFFWLAVLLLLAGAGARVLLSGSGVSERVPAAVAAGVAVGWAIVRLGMMRLVLGPGKETAARLRGGWSAGTACWIIAISPELAFVAWVVSAAATLLALILLRENRKRATKAIAAAWGVQAAASVIAWWVASGWFAVLLGRV